MQMERSSLGARMDRMEEMEEMDECEAEEMNDAILLRIFTFKIHSINIPVTLKSLSFRIFRTKTAKACNLLCNNCTAFLVRCHIMSKLKAKSIICNSSHHRGLVHHLLRDHNKYYRQSITLLRVIVILCAALLCFFFGAEFEFSHRNYYRLIPPAVHALLLRKDFMEIKIGPSFSASRCVALFLLQPFAGQRYHNLSRRRGGCGAARPPQQL